jgi:hypothetical protein
LRLCGCAFILLSPDIHNKQCQQRREWNKCWWRYRRSSTVCR